MNLSLFDYDLPESFIAQTPTEPRDSSRLLVLDKTTGDIQHLIFHDIVGLLNPSDVLVLNNTRVLPARLHVVKATGGKAEILLLHQLDETHWRGLIGGHGVKVGTVMHFPSTDISITIEAEEDGAVRILRFSQPIKDILRQHGEIPLPPYIHTQLADAERYQTIYSKLEGSAAAPTAGLHFTPELLLAAREKGVQIAYCTLHIGLDTFQPVKVDDIRDHHIHSEQAVLTVENARIINDAKLAGGRIIAVGTTSARTLETAGVLSSGGDPARAIDAPETCAWRPVIAFESSTNLFIYPGYQWRVVDAMITNFHLPKSTLLMMMSAFAGRESILNAYEIAKQQGYRFFSFGDAMFIR